MVQFILTPKLTTAITTTLSSPLCDDTLRDLLTPLTGSPDPPNVPTISHDVVRRVSEVLLQSEPGKRNAVSSIVKRKETDGGKAGNTSYHIHELLKGSKIHLNVPKPRTKSPELLQILEKIKHDLAAKEYEEMTRSVSQAHMRTRNGGGSIGSDLKGANRILSAVLNILFSMVAVFVALFYFGDGVTRDVAMKTLMSLAGAFIVGFAESWFFAKDWLFDTPPDHAK
ncbi:hypothetical protein HK104_008623 [Borealophlyctis nickersoniae]|nr:hypothetical protein HK104_008623 [Borealophlyctis nickersoniae]